MIPAHHALEGSWGVGQRPARRGCSSRGCASAAPRLPRTSGRTWGCPVEAWRLGLEKANETWGWGPLNLWKWLKKLVPCFADVSARGDKFTCWNNLALAMDMLGQEGKAEVAWRAARGVFRRSLRFSVHRPSQIIWRVGTNYSLWQPAWRASSYECSSSRRLRLHSVVHCDWYLISIYYII